VTDDDPVILCCARIEGPLRISDNLTGRCSECGFRVQFRPHAPRNRILRCLQCVSDLIQPDDEVITTDKMLADAAKYFGGKKQ
jgi:hypothetical protein